VISTVDPQARHGHKTSARGFDGYKGHVAIDPDSELITATAVTAGNIGDAAAARDLLAADLAEPEPGERGSAEPEPAEPGPADRASAEPPEPAEPGESLAVYGDSAYGSGAVLAMLEHADAQVMCKVQPPSAPAGRFAKDAFEIDLDAGHVTCPAGQVTPLLPVQGGHLARFGVACAGCPLAAQCTTATDGRSISVGPHEQHLTRARERQADPEWKADYTATRPEVERRIGHLMRRKHGGRRARVCGQTKVDADFTLLAGAVNLARLAVLGLTHNGAAWTAATG
jgi:DDE family transposase